jgi:hypothetical protein
VHASCPLLSVDTAAIVVSAGDGTVSVTAGLGSAVGAVVRSLKSEVRGAFYL